MLAKHGQIPVRNVCQNCMMGACVVCVDILRSSYTSTLICGCGKGTHHTEVMAAINRDRDKRRLDF